MKGVKHYRCILKKRILNQVIFAIVILFFLGLEVFAQNRYSPFQSSLYFGTGPSTTVDFNKSGNGGRIALHAGFLVRKYVSNSHFIQTGINYASRGSLQDEVIKYPYGTVVDISSIIIHSIDIPILMYSKVKSLNAFTYVFYGVRHSYLPIAPKIIDTFQTGNLGDNVFRRYNLIASSGIGKDLSNRIRLDCSINFSMLSIIRLQYRDEFLESSKFFGEKIHPFEIILAIDFNLTKM